LLVFYDAHPLTEGCGLLQDLSQKMFALFQEADEDGSGLIDIKEMEELLVKCEVDMDTKDLATLFNKYDDDGSGEISFKEFFMMIKELLDTANGYLSAEGEEEPVLLSPEGPGASPVRILFTQEMDEAYLEAEKLALAAEKIRRDSQIAEGLDVGDAGPDGGAEEATVLPAAPQLPRSMGFMSINHPLRRAVKAFIDYPPHKQENKWFDNLVLVGILTSSCLLALDNPNIGNDSPVRVNMENVGLGLNGLFLVESISKAMVLSLKGYLRSGWNKLDFLIVSTSCLDMGLTYGLQGQKVDLAALKIFRMLRILRALRPLRIIARAKGLKILVLILEPHHSFSHPPPQIQELFPFALHGFVPCRHRLHCLCPVATAVATLFPPKPPTLCPLLTCIRCLTDEGRCLFGCRTVRLGLWGGDR
jgi:hypothetical protein